MWVWVGGGRLTAVLLVEHEGLHQQSLSCLKVPLENNRQGHLDVETAAGL